MFKKFALILGLALAAPAAQATTVTFGLDAGRSEVSFSYTRAINLRGLLEDYRIIGGTLSVGVVDDADSTRRFIGAWSPYRQVDFVRGTPDVSFQERTRSEVRVRDYEDARLSVFNTQRDFVESTLSESFSEQRSNRPCSAITRNRQFCYTDVTELSLYFNDLGASTLNATLSADDVFQMEQLGRLSFRVGGFNGDFNVTGGTLTLDLEALPAAAVPLPGGAVLLLSALGLAGVARHRRGRGARRAEPKGALWPRKLAGVTGQGQSPEPGPHTARVASPQV